MSDSAPPRAGTRRRLSPAEVRAKHRELIFPNVANYYREPLVLERAEGWRVWDAEGRSYLDFFGGILTVAVGHCHPRVTGAIADQSARLGHTSTLYQNEGAVALAERLGALTPVDRPEGRPPKVFFTNSGTEADETAVLTARLFTGSQHVLALRHGYSGRSALSMSLAGISGWRHWGEGMPGVVHTMNGYCYRCPFALTFPSCDLRCARDAEEVIRTSTNGRVAALIAEPIQGVGGVITPPPEFFGVLAEIVRRYGGLFICDEVQTGFGRTGTHWSGIEHWGVRPEIVTFAKAVANGMPMGVTVARADVADSFRGLTISTFGGNPVAAAAAHATLDVLEEEDAPSRAARLGARFRAGLDALTERHPLIGDVRGLGLMLGIELVKDRGTKEPAPEATAALLETTRERGLLIGRGGMYGNVIRLAPPLVVGEREIDDALGMIDGALADVARAH